MRKVVEYFIKNEIVGNMLMFFLFIIGIVGVNRMKTTFFPETASRNIAIRAIYPGSSPQEIEEGIVAKIEENLKGVTGIERITSVSSENAGSVNVEVWKGYDTDLVLQDVKNAVDRINSFPAGMEPAVAYKIERLGRAIVFSINGDVDLKTLKKYAREVEEGLLAKEGLSKVTLSGFPEEEIEISFNENDLRAFNISFAEASIAIRNFNLEITGGTIKTNKEELLVRANNKKYTAKELSNVIVKTNPNGGVVRLYQIADIRDRWEDVPSRTYLNGRPSVIINVQNTLEEDMLTVNEMVRDYIHEFNLTHDVVKAEIIQDFSETLQQRIDLLMNNGLMGFGLVLFFLAIFLNYRLAFWVALSIPISFAGMFLIASMMEITINVISLFGMIIVVGILVDDGIVIAENIYQKSEKGMSAIQASIEGTVEVIPAVLSAIITTIIAFSAFFLIDGNLGDFFREMSVVVIFSLVFSLVEGVFILPAHIAHSKALSLSANEERNKFNQFFDKVMNSMRDKLYAPVLRGAIKYPLPTIAISIVSLFMIYGAFSGGLIKSTFFPNLPRDNFSVDLKLPAGTREDITIALLDSIENVSNQINDEMAQEFYNGENKPIVKIQKTIGPGTNQGVLEMSLLDGEARGDISAREVMGRIRTTLGPIYEAETLTFYAGSPWGKPVSLSLLGADKDELNRAVEAIKARLSQIKDLKDVVDNNQEGLKEINLTLKPEAYNLGFTLRDIVNQVRQGFFGGEVQRLQRGRDEVKVWVRYKEEDRSDLSNLSNMRIGNAQGQTIPLNQLAEFSIERGVININHIDGQREVRIEADVASDEASISDITFDIKNEIVPGILEGFPGVKIGFEGQDRQQAKTSKSMQRVIPMIFMLMFFVVVLTFKSIGQSMILFSLIPFGFVGVGIGHFLVGIPISFFSILGVIALIGIMINDGLVFISTHNLNIKKGMSFLESLEETGLSRFRPIVLTSVTTISGLAPLLLEKSLQAQFLIPMAVSVAFGLMIATLLMLVLLPSIMMIVNQIKKSSMTLWEGKEISSELVEPAFAGNIKNYPVYLFAAVMSLGLLVLAIYVTMKIGALVV